MFEIDRILQTKYLPTVFLSALLCSAPSLAQNPQGKWNAATDPRIIQGADNPDQNRWNAISPWGDIERIAPVEAQQKDPFRIFDNVYYVGFQTVSAYFVTTSAGLVLIDSGYEGTTEWLLEGIRRLGFAPADIRFLFITHAHRDHAGGATRIKQVSGARVGLSLADWTFLERQQLEAQSDAMLERDLVLDDGQQITVGDTTFTFYVTPGHTPGATSIEYTVRDGDHSYRTLSPGGLGLHYSANWGPIYRASMQRLKDLGPWDVMLSNHPFAMPRGLADIQEDIDRRQNGALHPAVVGAEAIDRFFDDVIAIVDRKLVEEPPTGPPPTL